MNLRGFLAALVLLAASTAHAAIVSLAPSSIASTVGQPVAVGVIVSGLGAGEAVGAFDLDVVFDATVLTATSVTFGSALGVEGIDQFSIALISSGRVDFAAASLLSEADLLAAQTAPFSLATLTFDAVAPGASGVNFDLTTFPGLLLSDAFGNALATTVGTESSVTVTAASVPEPSGVMLVLLALGVMTLPRVARARLRVGLWQGHA